MTKGKKLKNYMSLLQKKFFC